MKRIALLAAFLAAPVAASPSTPSPERQIDALFAPWTRPGMPGAVVGVIRDGKVVLTKRYGMADIERGVPMTPATEFVIGSMSKQFTAFAIHLLAKDGKLSLDDDVRTWLPDVPDFGKKITIRHLLHHTSGLRDYFDLMSMAGLRPGDVIAEDKALALIRRQRALNFAPGDGYLYSNTGYLLLGLIVQRASGKPLPEFARERIFAPLGMKHTLFQSDNCTLVPGRALPYEPADTGGYQYAAVNVATIGDGGVLTTAGDLALWDRNFYDGRVGGMDVVRQMQATGVLNDGKPIEYASGLFALSYRGLRLVEHSGSIRGYSSQLWRFPDQRLSVMVFANGADIDTYLAVRGIADMILDRVPGATPAAPAAPVKTFQAIPFDPARLDALVGYYATSPQSGATFTREGGRLMAVGNGLPKMPVFPYGERKFFAKGINAQFTFDAPGKDGIVAGGILHWGEQDIPATRTARPTPSAAELKRLEGDFYSDELHVLYSVAGKDGDLELTYPGGTVTLGFNGERDYATGFGTLTYQCNADGCSGFTVSTERASNVRFRRVELNSSIR
ncbi:CubicO group peptidase, beta-lactamase class C family [Massilia sp. PDC64]|nr:serine hydrolase domain-containing protein [Massilia sp. PDC64]SDC30484.1 CubicO group peptidase, beta-lactamase class C family [Massilia sp. PDC64]